MATARRKLRPPPRRPPQGRGKRRRVRRKNRGACGSAKRSQWVWARACNRSRASRSVSGLLRPSAQNEVVQDSPRALPSPSTTFSPKPRPYAASGRGLYEPLGAPQSSVLDSLFVVFLPHSNILYLRFYDTGYSDKFVRLFALRLQSPNGELEMPSFGLDRLFVSTSLALLLLTTVPATLADPTGASIDATKRAQETGRSLAETGSERATTQPLDLSDEAEAPSPQTMAPTELAKPDELTGQPNDPTSTLAAPTSTPNPNQPLAEREAPVATSNQGPSSLPQPPRHSRRQHRIHSRPQRPRFRPLR